MITKSRITNTNIQEASDIICKLLTSLNRFVYLYVSGFWDRVSNDTGHSMKIISAKCGIVVDV